MIKFRKLAAGLGVLGVLSGGSGTAQGAVLLSEGFDSFLPAGWAAINNSAPVGTTGWFAGNPGIFPAESGPADSYAAANFHSADIGGDISNWLLTPELTLSNGDTFSFFTQASGILADRMEVRVSTNGGSSDVGATATSVGDFANLLLTINSTLNPNGYPEGGWAKFTIQLSGVGASTQGRVAFRYFVEDTNVNGEYIGVDTVLLETGAGAVPEPSTLLVVALGLFGLGAHLRRPVAP